MPGKPENISHYDKQHQLLLESYISLSKDPVIWSGELNTALQRVTEVCARVMQVARVSVWRMDADGSTMQCLMLHQSGKGSDDTLLDLVAATDYYHTLSDERLIEVNNALADPRLSGIQAYLKQHNIHALLDAIIRIEGEIKGVLSFESVGYNRLWNEHEKNFLTSVADLVGQLFAIAALRDSEKRYKALFDGAGDAIFMMRDGHFVTCNAAAEAMFGYNSKQFGQLTPADISPPRQPDGADSMQRSVALMQLACQRPQRFEWQHCRADGRLFDAEVTLKGISTDGYPSLIAMVRDITERKRNEAMLAQSRQELEHRANHDSLTGLPNRSCLHERMAQWLGSTECRHSGIALMLLDLNRFKEVNDTLGHRVGDQLLKTVAHDLAMLLASHPAEVFRLGGDEFVILARGSHQQVQTLAEQVCAALREPRSVECIRLELSGSVGIAHFPEHGDSSHALLRCADVAMYHAKANGFGSMLYNSQYDSHSPRRLALISDLATAIREDQLVLYFQPRIDLHSGRCIGCEALIRWQHPQQGMVPPADFIPAAEMSDIIHPLSQWVLSQALRQSRQWLDAGIQLAVAVNLSARNLVDQQCPQLVGQLLQQFGIAAHLLEIEITESALISDPERALEVLQQFRQLGLTIAIDDFGTGYSSLNYLKRLPIHTLKIDRSFVQHMLVEPADEVIVRSTIGLAHSFGLTVVAEGVEDSQTLAALQALGCDQAQGFYIARPLPAAEFVQWLARRQG